MALPPLTLSSNATARSDGILDGLTLGGGAFQVGGGGAKLSSSGPDNLNSSGLPAASMDIGILAAIAAGVFALMFAVKGLK